ncbi:hypothetical protein BDP27DRAFT_1374345 [Rhodocollybia butyracea]|uniref:Uncharacterized protein n=1 Tax=Rhodocollybia butyracea TaxID=206335 RepID=A0A9P5P5F3_9AGAR|nr:hypothetical protein BDP27DRAFT_1374345 [Rhodocollybia butyracea]
MEWDARRLFKYDTETRTWKCFIQEAYTANDWCNIQSKLPSGAVPLCIVFYADKSKLSSFGAAKGYPVPEDAAHSGKTDYVDFKNIVWHSCVGEIFESIVGCVITLIQGLRGLCCVKCLIPTTELTNFDMDYPERTPESMIVIVHEALKLGQTSKADQEELLKISFDDLHFFVRLWDHIFKVFKFHISDRDSVTLVDSRLHHFSDGVMKTTFNDGSKHADISKVLRKYMNMVMYAEFDIHTTDTIASGRASVGKFVDALHVGNIQLYMKELESLENPKSWNFVKLHYLRHLYNDIENKGSLCGMSTKPNEKFHGYSTPVVATQIQNEIDAYDAFYQPQVDTETPDDLETPTNNAHFMIGSKLKPITFAELSELDSALFSQIHICVSDFLSDLLPTSNIPLSGGKRISYTINETVIPYQYLKINYDSFETWQLASDQIHCNPNFWGTSRYDFIIFNARSAPVFAQLLYMFAYKPVGVQSRIDKDMGFLHIWKERSTEFISLHLVIRGVVVFEASEDPRECDERLVYDALDHDIFLRVKKFFPGYTDGSFYPSTSTCALPFLLNMSGNKEEFDFSDTSDDPELTRLYCLMLKALETLHLQNQKVVNNNMKLHMQVSDLKLQLKLAKTVKTGQKKLTADHDPLLNHNLILKLGKKSTIMVHPWATLLLFVEWPPRNAPNPESEQQFHNYDMFTAGLLPEFHSYLNDHELCQKAAEYAPFKNAFILQTKNGHTAAIHMLRDCTSIIFSSLDVPAMVLNNLLKFPGETKIGPLSPIFYPNFLKDDCNLFMNKFQSKILLHFNMVLPLLAQFLLSSNKEFVLIGKNSQINYQPDFFVYRQMLNSLTGTNYVKHLYAFHNSRVFPGLPGLSSTATAPSGVVSEDAQISSIAETLLAIRLADLESASPSSSVAPTISASSSTLASATADVFAGPPESISNEGLAPLPEHAEAAPSDDQELAEATATNIQGSHGRGCGHGCGRGSSMLPDPSADPSQSVAPVTEARRTRTCRN